MSTPDDPASEIARLAAASGPAAAASPPAPRPSGYLDVTRTATYGYLAAIPLFVLYEVGVLLANTGPGQVRVGADVWLKSLLAALGGTGTAALGAAVMAVGGVVWWRDRERRPPLVPRYFAWILAEALVYAVVLASLVSGTVGAIFGVWAWPLAALGQVAELGLGLQLALSIGAGLYEELVFRVILVGGLFWALQRATALDRRTGYWVAAVVGAAVFSAVPPRRRAGRPVHVAGVHVPVPVRAGAERGVPGPRVRARGLDPRALRRARGDGGPVGPTCRGPG